MSAGRENADDIGGTAGGKAGSRSSTISTIFW